MKPKLLVLSDDPKAYTWGSWAERKYNQLVERLERTGQKVGKQTLVMEGFTILLSYVNGLGKIVILGGGSPRYFVPAFGSSTFTGRFGGALSSFALLAADALDGRPVISSAMPSLGARLKFSFKSYATFAETTAAQLAAREAPRGLVRSAALNRTDGNSVRETALLYDRATGEYHAAKSVLFLLTARIAGTRYVLVSWVPLSEPTAEPNILKAQLALITAPDYRPAGVFSATVVARVDAGQVAAQVFGQPLSFPLAYTAGGTLTSFYSAGQISYPGFTTPEGTGTVSEVSVITTHAVGSDEVSVSFSIFKLALSGQSGSSKYYEVSLLPGGTIGGRVGFASSIARLIGFGLAPSRVSTGAAEINLVGAAGVTTDTITEFYGDPTAFYLGLRRTTTVNIGPVSFAESYVQNRGQVIDVQHRTVVDRVVRIDIALINDVVTPQVTEHSVDVCQQISNARTWFNSTDLPSLSYKSITGQGLTVSTFGRPPVLIDGLEASVIGATEALSHRTCVNIPGEAPTRDTREQAATHQQSAVVGGVSYGLTATDPHCNLEVFSYAALIIAGKSMAFRTYTSNNPSSANTHVAFYNGQDISNAFPSRVLDPLTGTTSTGADPPQAPGASLTHPAVSYKDYRSDYFTTSPGGATLAHNGTEVSSSSTTMTMPAPAYPSIPELATTFNSFFPAVVTGNAGSYVSGLTGRTDVRISCYAAPNILGEEGWLFFSLGSEIYYFGGEAVDVLLYTVQATAAAAVYMAALDALSAARAAAPPDPTAVAISEAAVEVAETAFASWFAHVVTNFASWEFIARLYFAPGRDPSFRGLIF